MNLLDIFLQTAARQPDHPLITTAREAYTYQDFQCQIEGLVAQLKAQGVLAGSCIGLHYPNSAEYISLTYAIWGCGACVAPIPVELSPQEKQQIFAHICIDAVISKADIAADLGAIQASAAQPLATETVLIQAKQFCAPPPGFAAVNAAFVRFSSGTTGAAKGVVLSHETIYERIQAANGALAIGPEDRIVWLLSMAYHFAVSIVAYLSFGATILLCPNSFGATIIRLAAKHKATILYGAPTHYALMTQDKSTQMLPDLRLAIVTTTALPPDIATAFYERFHKPLNETYGIIEVGLPCINFEKPLAKSGSVGRVLPAYEIHIDKIDQAHNWGAIYLRGKGVIDAYYAPWQTRAELLQANNGWFATGDIGEVDEEGYLYIRGRSKEVVSVGGMKFFPQEVEAVLEAHPAIQAACVFRYPDQRLGEIPHAYLVKMPEFEEVPTVEELNAFCTERLALYKVPKQFRFVPALLRTASGKLIRDAAKLLAQGAIEG